MANLVVIVDMRPNNPDSGPLGLVDEEGDRLTLFKDRLEIDELRRVHILGPFPWIVVDLDTGMAELV